MKGETSQSVSSIITQKNRENQRQLYSQKHPTEAGKLPNIKKIQESVQQQIKAHLELSVTKGIEQGVKSAGLSLSRVKNINPQAAQNESITVAGLYNPQNNVIALNTEAVKDLALQKAGLERSHKTPESLQSVVKAAREQTIGILEHEKVHQKIEVNASKTGQSGYIPYFLGGSTYHDLHEWAASKGNSDGSGPATKDSYDPERSRSKTTIRKLGMTEHEAYQKLLAGKHIDFVIAAIRQGVITIAKH